ncbi:phage head spike fiber domain-containing protein [Polyangium aurulentum]|uniref:phage head spike fiber domain-containing protein n=1 Tax=Polyangium aurulentum TaxID=2567896 RepID=UPI0010ADDD26|nr:hypothetical protein [Polyangium aurulentum]UQA62050.1 hypothetical protein E8A73_016860 [Polyangium aurulentum]
MAAIASLATFTWGCQFLSGVDGDLVLSAGGGDGPVGVEGEPLTWEATDPGGSPVYELPEWLSIKNTSDKLTSQHGDVLMTGYGPNAARPRKVGEKWGLAIEKERTNYVIDSAWFGAGWNPGEPPMSVTPGEADPTKGDDLMEGVRFASNGQEQSNWTTVGVGGVMASSWVRGVTGTDPYAYFAFGDNWQDVKSGEWVRYEVPYTAGERKLRFETQGFKPAPITTSTAVIAYGAQVEEGKYPSSFIPTFGEARLRDADALDVREDSVSPKGWFSVTIRFAPHYAMGEMESVHDIINLFRDQIFVRLQRDLETEMGTLVLRVPGSDAGVTNLKIGGLDWKREQPLTIVAWSTPDGRFLSIEGATTGNGEASSPVPAKPLVEPITKLSRILGEKNGAQESADLQYIQFR